MCARIPIFPLIGVKTKAQNGERLCQGYPVNLVITVELQLWATETQSYACSTTSVFKYVVPRQPASKLLGLSFKWPSPRPYLRG